MPNKLWFRYLFSVALVLIPTLVSLGLSSGLMLSGIFPSDPAEWSSLQFLIQIFMQAVIFLTVVWVFAVRLKLPHFTWIGPVHGLDVMFAIFGWVLVSIFTAGVVQLFNLEPRQLESFDINKLAPTWYFFAFATAAIAPIYEEITFRGFLLRLLVNEKSERFRWSVLAVVFSSLLFTVTHEYTVWVPVFILSLYLSALTIAKKNIMLSLIVHSFQNFIMTLQIFFFPG